MKKIIILLTLLCTACIHANPIYEVLDESFSVPGSEYEKFTTPKIMYFTSTGMQQSLNTLRYKGYDTIAISERFAAKNRKDAEKMALEVHKLYPTEFIFILNEKEASNKYEPWISGDKIYTVGYISKILNAKDSNKCKSGSLTQMETGPSGKVKRIICKETMPSN